MHKNRALIGAVGKQLLKKRKFAEQRGEQQEAPIAILDVGGMDDGVPDGWQGRLRWRAVDSFFPAPLL